jgi:AcrR family transcriptional regulator
MLHKFEKLTRLTYRPFRYNHCATRNSVHNPIEMDIGTTLKATPDQKTPLILALANADRPPATPLGVFKLARKYWLEGKRISIGDLAREVGVSRVTLYRWVGSKERLIEEILWSFARPTFENAVQETPGTGVEHIMGVHRRFMTALATFEPMRRFILQNPTTAIRIQTDKDPQSAHSRLIAATAAHLEEQASRGYFQLPAPARKLAEMIIYTNGALIYSAIIGDRATAAIEQACAISRMLLMGMLPDDQAHSSPSRRAKTAHSINKPRSR